LSASRTPQPGAFGFEGPYRNPDIPEKKPAHEKTPENQPKSPKFTRQPRIAQPAPRVFRFQAPYRHPEIPERNPRTRKRAKITFSAARTHHSAQRPAGCSVSKALIAYPRLWFTRSQ
jgi:hypothetical protein